VAAAGAKVTPRRTGALRITTALLGAALLALGCGALPAPGEDAGWPDAGAGDAGALDGGASDAGTLDAGLPDAGDEDAGLPDAGGLDAGFPDAGPADGGAHDAGLREEDAGAPDAGAPDAALPTDAGAGCPLSYGLAPSFTFRAMAANLTSGNLQSYDPGHGMRIIEGAQPDVVLLQEWNYGSNTTQDFDDFVSATLGGDFSYHRGTGQIPNGVISRWPIVQSGEWNDTASTNREFTWARIDLPGSADLWAVSVHLLTASAATRNAEAQQLMQYLANNVFLGDYVLVGGDFNTDTWQEPAYATFAPRFDVAEPQPADQQGNGHTNASRTKPYDGVFASRCLGLLQVPTVIGASRFDAGAVLDTRVYTPISELFPALASDSAATNMQHMGVVKDFTVRP
jgi:endonuclease/exonuclease/phosphatase family metal-dependent hydrolase